MNDRGAQDDDRLQQESLDQQNQDLGRTTDPRDRDLGRATNPRDPDLGRATDPRDTSLQTTPRTTVGETEPSGTSLRRDDSITSQSDVGFFEGGQLNEYRDRWSDIQAAFVDDPKNAVEQAHELVTQIVDSLVQTFTRERGSLEQQWSSGGNADTEQLRIALQRYRDFFNRLLGS